MEDAPEAIRQRLGGFLTTLVSFWEEKEKAELALRDAEAKLEAAKKAREKALLEVRAADGNLELLDVIAENLGLDGKAVLELVETTYTESRSIKGNEEHSGRRRVSNQELMIFIGDLIISSGHPLNMDQIMDGIERAGIYLPGREPRKNMLAYLSRSPFIRSVRKGWYDAISSVLEIAKAEFEETKQPKLFEDD